MANTAFDPLRADPFATATPTFTEPPTPIQTLVPYGSQQGRQGDDVLLDFTNGNSPPTMNNQSRFSSSSSSSKDTENRIDVRETRKERVMMTKSPTSVRTNAKNVTLAPPPEIPIKRSYLSTRFNATYTRDPASQPNYEKIIHSGKCLARISIRTKLLRVWKSVFWIVYDNCEFLVFKSEQTFQEWLMNPYLTRDERDALVKLHINFQTDSKTHGYQASMTKLKYYRKDGMIHQFKLDKWNFAEGPSILAAFGSINLHDINELYIIMKGMLEESPVNIDRMGFQNVHDSYNAYDMNERTSSYFSGGDSVRSVPTFARPKDYAASTHSAKSHQGNLH